MVQSPTFVRRKSSRDGASPSNNSRNESPMNQVVDKDSHMDQHNVHMNHNNDSNTNDNYDGTISLRLNSLRIGAAYYARRATSATATVISSNKYTKICMTHFNSVVNSPLLHNKNKNNRRNYFMLASAILFILSIMMIQVIHSNKQGHIRSRNQALQNAMNTSDVFGEYAPSESGDEEDGEEYDANSTSSNMTLVEMKIERWRKKKLLKEIILDGPQKEPLNETMSSSSSLPSKRKQKMFIIAGPHFTQANNIQQTLWKWTAYNTTQNYTKPILDDWVWPIPRPVAFAEFAELENSKWTPAHVYYPILEAVKIYLNRRRDGIASTEVPKRLLFQKYRLPTIFNMFQDVIAEFWTKGYNLILGTEAFNHIVTYPELSSGMMQLILKQIIPNSHIIKGEQITVVVMYRMNKLDHLLSAWRDTRGITFQDWIWYGSASMYSLIDSLGMVQIFLTHTDWNVALVDMKGVDETGWDLATYISCFVMKASECDEDGMKGFDDEADKEPVATIEWEKSPNIANETLEQIENSLRTYDCNYKDLIEDSGGSNGRLTVFEPLGLVDTMKHCDSIDKDRIPNRKGLADNILDIIGKHWVYTTD